MIRATRRAATGDVQEVLNALEIGHNAAIKAAGILDTMTSDPLAFEVVKSLRDLMFDAAAKFSSAKKTVETNDALTYNAGVDDGAQTTGDVFEPGDRMALLARKTGSDPNRAPTGPRSKLSRRDFEAAGRYRREFGR